jgi:hypothetical protein
MTAAYTCSKSQLVQSSCSNKGLKNPIKSQIE